MKKSLLLPVMILSSFILSAQNDLVIKGTKKISKEMTPQEVIDSLHKRFPNAKAFNITKCRRTSQRLMDGM